MEGYIGNYKKKAPINFTGLLCLLGFLIFFKFLFGF